MGSLLEFHLERQMEAENRKKSHVNNELRHLGFVRVAAIHAVFCVSGLYDYVKRNFGPLRSTVGTVEGAVNALVRPVYEKFKGVPADLLTFLDQKVDEASHKFDQHAPPLAKKIAGRAHGLIETASKKAQKFVDKARTGGPWAALHYAGAESRQLLLSQGVVAWVKLNEIPPLHRVAEAAIPAAAQWSKKYNYTIEELSRKGYPVVGCLPLVPVDEIAKAFKHQKKEGDQ
ncbi:hypothetical protein SAY86_002674 [Trapa natans]|uniref:REF/SRPP-like protein n=1 Tax=Trapa natans TaxID=22666 RepID=A0AAN7LI81_TRANT|nr:hypothetical protein SAY86_002674 [Trapa natans]